MFKDLFTGPSAPSSPSFAFILLGHISLLPSSILSSILSQGGNRNSVTTILPVSAPLTYFAILQDTSQHVYTQDHGIPFVGCSSSTMDSRTTQYSLHAVLHCWNGLAHRIGNGRLPSKRGMPPYPLLPASHV